MAGFLGGGGGGGGASTINYNITNNGPGGWLSVVDFGAVADGTVSGGTDNQSAFQDCADACRAQGKTMYIPAGNWRTGVVNRTDVSIRGDGSEISVVFGNEGEDVFYWLPSSDGSYTRPYGHSTRGLSVYMDGAVDHRTDYTRIGWGGERIGHCAFIVPGGVWKIFDDVTVRCATAGRIALNGACALYCPEPAYGLSVTTFMAREVSFGVIDGVWDGHAEMNLQGPASCSSSTITIANHGFVNGDQVAFIWDSNESTSDVTPRTVGYYVINAATNTFQISLTAGGAAVTITADVGWAPWVVYADASAPEYASDEKYFGRLTCNCEEAALVLCNNGVTTVNSSGLQSSRVSLRLLNFQSLARYSGESLTMSQMYVEGPLDATWGDDLEYYRIEWNGVLCNDGPHVRGNTSVTTLYATIAGDDNEFRNIHIATDRKLYVTGNNNVLARVHAYDRETAVVDSGRNNKVVMAYVGDGGDRLGVYSNYAPRNASYQPLGGFSPDYIAKKTNYYPGEGWNFIPGASMRTGTAGTVTYDSTLETLSYQSWDTSFELRYFNGTNQIPIKTDYTIPRCLIRARAKVRVADSCNVALKGQWLSPGGGWAGQQSTAVSASTWTIIDCEIDASTYADNTMQLLVVADTTTTLDVAWIHLLPTDTPYVTKLDMGSSVFVTQYAGSPESNVTADPGSFCLDTTNGEAYIKKTGTGNTGWKLVTHA